MAIIQYIHYVTVIRTVSRNYILYKNVTCIATLYSSIGIDTGKHNSHTCVLILKKLWIIDDAVFYCCIVTLF